MSPPTRMRLRRAWGLCERHSWGWMSVEAAFRSGYMHGPAVLYEDVMSLAVAAFDVRGPMQMGRLRRRIRQKGPCLMCEEGYGPDSTGFVKPQIVSQGRDLSELRVLAAGTSPYWREAVCGTCAGTDSAQRCRRHLIEDERRGLIHDPSESRALVKNIFSHMVKYARSFQYEFHGTHTEEDMASLISAVGWCSGWKLLLSIMGEPVAALRGK